MVERLKGKREVTEDILGEVQKALDLLCTAADILEASRLSKMNYNVRGY